MMMLMLMLMIMMIKVFAVVLKITNNGARLRDYIYSTDCQDLMSADSTIKSPPPAIVSLMRQTDLIRTKIIARRQAMVEQLLAQQQHEQEQANSSRRRSTHAGGRGASASRQPARASASASFSLRTSAKDLSTSTSPSTAPASRLRSQSITRSVVRRESGGVVSSESEDSSDEGLFDGDRMLASSSSTSSYLAGSTSLDTPAMDVDYHGLTIPVNKRAQFLMQLEFGASVTFLPTRTTSSVTSGAPSLSTLKTTASPSSPPKTTTTANTSTNTTTTTGSPTIFGDGDNSPRTNATLIEQVVRFCTEYDQDFELIRVALKHQQRQARDRIHGLQAITRLVQITGAKAPDLLAFLYPALACTTGALARFWPLEHLFAFESPNSVRPEGTPHDTPPIGTAASATPSPTASFDDRGVSSSSTLVGEAGIARPTLGARAPGVAGSRLDRQASNDMRTSASSMPTPIDSRSRQQLRSIPHYLDDIRACASDTRKSVSIAFQQMADKLVHDEIGRAHV